VPGEENLMAKERVSRLKREATERERVSQAMFVEYIARCRERGELDTARAAETMLARQRQEQAAGRAPVQVGHLIILPVGRIAPQVPGTTRENR
jgi:hypothetical protein